MAPASMVSDLLQLPIQRHCQPISSDWRSALPVLTARGVSLRELTAADAPSLLAGLTTAEVTRFISPPPTTVEGFQRFISWTHRERSAGRSICFGIVPTGVEHAVGIIQFRDLDGRFSTAEWGFALASTFWGTGIFVEAACAALTFCMLGIGVDRLEARACVSNDRGNGVLRKLGAREEALLQEAFERNGVMHDQVLWVIRARHWLRGAPPESPGQPATIH